MARASLTSNPVATTPWTSQDNDFGWELGLFNLLGKLASN
jgi:hypothetical protein